MKKSDLIYARKEFLNLPGQESVANIVTHIKIENWGNNDELYRNTSYTLDITDCTDVIHLSIDHEDEYDRENGLYKLDTLISVLTDFRGELVKEFEIQADLQAKRKLKKEKEEAEAALAAEEAKEEADKKLEEIKELKKKNNGI